MSERKDFYEVLGVERGADAAELKRAYRKLAMELHPDRNPGDTHAEDRFKEASEAYQVLCDPEKRAYYDRFGHAGPGMSGGGFHDVHDIFSAFGDVFGDLFGGGFPGGGRGRRAPARGADIETRASLTLVEAASGVRKKIELRRRAPCSTCAGTGAAAGSRPETCQQCGGRGQVMHSQGFLMISTTCPVCRGEGQVIRKPCPKCDGAGIQAEKDVLEVSIPAGVEDGSTLRVPGRGEAGPRNGQAGNLYVVLHVEPDERFERNGADLHTEVEVSFPQLALGDRIMVPTLEGETEIEIPPGTQPGDTLALRGCGMPLVDGRGKGDVVAHVKMVVPPSLSAEEETHLRAYAEAASQRVNREPTGDPLRRRKKK